MGVGMIYKLGSMSGCLVKTESSGNLDQHVRATKDG